MGRRPSAPPKKSRGDKGYWGQVVAANVQEQLNRNGGLTWRDVIARMPRPPRGCDEMSLYRWGRGSNDPSLAILVELARAFGVAVADLLREARSTKPHEPPREQIPSADWEVFWNYRHANEETRQIVRHALEAATKLRDAKGHA